MAVEPSGSGDDASAFCSSTRSYGFTGTSRVTSPLNAYRPTLIGKPGCRTTNESVASSIALSASRATMYLGRASPFAADDIEPDTSSNNAIDAPRPSSPAGTNLPVSAAEGSSKLVRLALRRT